MKTKINTNRLNTLHESIHKEKLRTVKVIWSDGSSMTTNLAARLSDDDIKQYYKKGKIFNIGSGAKDKMVTVRDVQILESVHKEASLSTMFSGIERFKTQMISDIDKIVQELQKPQRDYSDKTVAKVGDDIGKAAKIVADVRSKLFTSSYYESVHKEELKVDHKHIRKLKNNNIDFEDVGTGMYVYVDESDAQRLRGLGIPYKELNALKEAKFKVGDFVSYNGRVGKIDNITSDRSTAEIRWNDGRNKDTVLPINVLKRFESTSKESHLQTGQTLEVAGETMVVAEVREDGYVLQYPKKESTKRYGKVKGVDVFIMDKASKNAPTGYLVVQNLKTGETATVKETDISNISTKWPLKELKPGDKVHTPAGFAKVLKVVGDKVLVRSNDPAGDFEFDMKQVQKE